MNLLSIFFVLFTQDDRCERDVLGHRVRAPVYNAIRSSLRDCCCLWVRIFVHIHNCVSASIACVHAHVNELSAVLHNFKCSSPAGLRTQRQGRKHGYATTCKAETRNREGERSWLLFLCNCTITDTHVQLTDWTNSTWCTQTQFSVPIPTKNQMLSRVIPYPEFS